MNLTTLTLKHKPYIFKWGDRLINVWVVTEFSHTYIQLSNGICYAQVMSVIRKKIATSAIKTEHFLSILPIASLECVGQIARERPLYSLPTGENPNDYRDEKNRLTKTDVI